MPFMEYAGSYALYNYKLADPSKGMEYDNIRLIRAFEHGLDPKSSEAGFVLVHIDMVQNSGPLVSGTVEALEAAHESREELNDALRKMLGALKKINATVSFGGGGCSKNDIVMRVGLTLVIDGNHVDEIQAFGLHHIPYFHLWYYQPVHVPQRRGVRGHQRRQTHVLPWRVRCQRLHDSADG